MQANGSEVAALQQQIAVEYLSGKLGLYGLNAGTARHAFITARQERIGALHEELQGLVGEEAIALVTETLTDVPDSPTRSDVLTVLRHQLGNHEETEILCDHLQEMWETVDILIDRFGVEQAHKITLTPSSSFVRDIPPS